jgi:hypothetical protein
MGSGLLGIALAILAGCGGPAATSSVPWPTMPVSITPAPGEVWWPLDAGLGTVTTLDGTLLPGQAATILSGFEAGLSPPSPTSSSRQVVFELVCEPGTGEGPRWWLAPDPEQVAGCGDSLAWTLTYDANRVRLGLALGVGADTLEYHLTAKAHSPY